MSEHIDPVEFAQKMAPILRSMVAPLEARIAELEGRPPVKEIPSDEMGQIIAREVGAWLEANPPAQGEKGEPAEPVLVSDVVAELVKSDLLSPVLDMYVEERVEKHFAEHPVKDGKDAEPVSQETVAAVVKEYLTANPPAPGRDGLDVKGLFREEGGHLIAVMSDGTTKDLGQFVGKDGKDGLGFEDASLEVSDGTATLKFVRGDLVKSVSFPLPTMKHIGFWQGGMEAKSCETTTHDGSLWIALRDTKETPSYQSKDWQLAARKGADGQHAKDAPPPQPVKLNGTR